jgi:hypothetical protein
MTAKIGEFKLTHHFMAALKFSKGSHFNIWSCRIFQRLPERKNGAVEFFNRSPTRREMLLKFSIRSREEK